VLKISTFFSSLEYSLVSILREDVRGGDEPKDISDLDNLPKGPSNEQRVEEGQYGRRNRQPDVR
jgi:hypothetical protein